MSNTANLQVVNFTVGAVSYGVPVEQVREVREMQSVTPIPGAPDYIEGVTNLRGKIITVLNLQKRLNLPSKAGGNGKMVIVETDKASTGVMVDSVAEVSTIAGVDLEKHLEVSTTNNEYVIGVGQQAENLVVVLNLAKIIEASKESSDEKVDNHKPV